MKHPRRRVLPLLAGLLAGLPIGACGEAPPTLEVIQGPIQGAPIDAAPRIVQAKELLVEAPGADEELAGADSEAAPEERGAPEGTVADPQAGEEPATEDGVLTLDFEQLDLPDYLPAEERSAEEPEIFALEQFPESIQALHGREVAIEGFMIVADWKDQRLESFLLARYPPGCCFGMVPVFYEWMHVTVPEDLAVEDSPPYSLIEVEGVLSVGEEVDEDGYATSLYRMVCAGTKEAW